MIKTAKVRSSASRQRSRKLLASGGALAATALLVGACGNSSTHASSSGTTQPSAAATTATTTAAATDITWAEIPGSYDSVPLTLGQQMGIFAQHHINLHLVKAGSGPLVVSTVLSGSAQVGDSLNPQVVAAAVQNGQNIRFICGESPHSDGALVALPGSKLPTTAAAGGIKAAVAALKGSTIGVPALGGAAAVLTKNALAAEGLSAKEYTMVAVGVGATAFGALKSGRVDVLFTYPFFQQNIEGLNEVKQLVDFTAIPVYYNTYASGIAASKSWISSHQSVAAQICDAYQAAAQAAQNPSNKSAVTAILEKDYGVAASGLADAMKVVQSFSTQMTPAEINGSYQPLVTAGLLKSSPAVSYDNTVMNPK